MYTDFFNLKEKPFNLTPSPRFLYLGEVHKEALSLLLYGVTERKGFILLTGEVGTGKTTMIHALLESLDNTVHCVHLSNPLLSPNDFLKHIVQSALKQNLRFKTRSEVLEEFELFLRDCLKNQKIFIIIIDEAQKLSFELLEEIRLLSNMETGEDKLVNIFLVGQPEFNDILNEPRCRPLRQRIAIRYHMRPLDLTGTNEYIYKRLKMAGLDHGEKIIGKEAVKAIYHYSKGYPRVINVLGDNLLLLGYSRGSRKITPEMVKECYSDTKLEGLNNNYVENGAANTEEDSQFEAIPKYWKWLAGFALCFFSLLIIGGTFIYIESQQKRMESNIKEFREEIRTIQSSIEKNQNRIFETLKSKEAEQDLKKPTENNL